ncbi:hypothetical protein GGS26DRAFT_539905 [Hypomontagnella submonticulosa]|nr:hypothetical protein GGS26DRAFT_539905 [Hypomontagnella submonticulosa]
MSSATTSKTSQSTSPTSTTSEKSQPTSSTSAASMSDKENPGSNASTKPKGSEGVREVPSYHDVFRKAEEELAKMSPEEIAENFPWPEHFKNATPTPADQLPPDFWDEI